MPKPISDWEEDDVLALAPGPRRPGEDDSFERKGAQLLDLTIPKIKVDSALTTSPTKVLIAVTFLLAGTIASAQHCRKIDIDKSSGFCTVPDPKLTPGEMDASLACVSNNERPRNVTTAEKNSILAAYGYPASTKKSTGEFDHWYPHWMGGMDTQENIWFEPHNGTFGSFTKDKVELLLWRKVCVNKTMALDQAKAAYLKGWTKLLPQP